MTNPKITISPGTSPIEGETGTYLITLDKPAPEGGLTVHYDSVGSYATLNSEYNFAAGENLSAVTADSFTIAAGATTATLNLVTVANTIYEPFNSVMLNVTPGTGYDFIANNTRFRESSIGNWYDNNNIFSIATADFNNDGNADLAMLNNGDNAVSVYLGNSSGSFTNKGKVAVGVGPSSVIVADFNGDGNMDLATANQYDISGNSTVSIRLGNGSGGFISDANIVMDTVLSLITTADFNGDGNADLLTTNWEGTVSVLLGNGSGGFTGNTSIAVGRNPNSIVTADFNNDGDSDLAITSDADNTVSIRLGDGRGGFSGKTSVTVGNGSHFITAADFNNDGNVDLATTNFTISSEDSSVSVRLGNGSGGFTGDTDIAMAPFTESITTADFNGDGNADLATISNWNSSVSVHLGNGNGGFTDNASIVVGNSDSLVAGDFNGDGNTDLAIAGLDNRGFNNNPILLNTGNVVSAKLTITDNGLYQPLNLQGDQGGPKNDVLTGGKGNDWLWGEQGADSLSGGLGNDWLIAGNGNDKLNGGRGNDILDGGVGRDTLTGGTGSDVFGFTSKPLAANPDKITDFNVADDTIQLARSLFTQLTNNMFGVLTAKNFVVATTAADSNDYLVYNKTTGALLYDADGNGAGAATQIAVLGVNLALTHADFVII